MARLRWTLDRMAEMPPVELPHRVREGVRRRLDRFGRRRPALAPALLASPPPSLAIDRADLAAVAPDTLDADVEGLLSTGFVLLGQRRRASQRSDWTLDPETGSRWPAEAFCFDIDFRVDRTRDIKAAWELSRLQHLQILALAGALGDARARDACLFDVRSWIQANPPYRGIGYAAGVEVACRIASLVVVGSLIDVPRDLRPAVWRALDAHGAWLARYPSLHSSANNHRIAELGALVLLGALAPGLPEAVAWLAEGCEGLGVELTRQVYADGVGAEQSPTYLAWGLEWAALADRALEVARRPAVPGLSERLGLGVGFLGALLDASGRHPRIGDDDETVVIRDGLAPDRRVASVSGCVAARLGRADLCPSGWRPDLRAALLGVANARAGRAQPRVRRSFPLGGYTVVPLPGGMVVLDHGPLGLDGRAAHGHADALSIWMHLDGHPVLVDSGTYRYTGDPAWRRYLRGTAAHSTLTLDDADQSEQHGPFGWSRRAAARRIEAGDAVTADHDGYEARFGVVHRRTVAVDDRCVRVEDRLEGRLRAAATLRIRFHLSPDLDLGAVEERFEARRNGVEVLRIEPPVGLTASIVRQRSAPAPGVHSPRYGTRVSAACLVLEGCARVGETYRTNLWFETISRGGTDVRDRGPRRRGR
jgi:hypothetical protein